MRTDFAATASRPRRRRRAGKSGIVGFILLLLLALGVYATWIFVPPVWTRQKMREITKSVALDWAALNRTKAERRVLVEFRRQEIPDYIADDACELEEKGNNRIVSCSWSVDVYYVPTSYFKTLAYTTRVEVDSTGEVISEE